MVVVILNNNNVGIDFFPAGFHARGLNMLVRVTLGLFVAGCVIGGFCRC